MDSDCYEVEVLHYLNPYLIWVEVKNSELAKKHKFVFEQLGVYGVLPLGISINFAGKGLETQRSREWTPAATNFMKTFLNDATQVLFHPTYVDKRSSIFNDNIHKYGEILAIKPDGTVNKLSKHLTQANLAYQDPINFHRELSSGELKTKLNTTTTHQVIIELEKCCERKEKPTNYWEKSVKSQTSISRLSMNLNSTLSMENLKRHDSQLRALSAADFNALIKKKIKDLELCKDIDEESVGRAVGSKERNPNTKVELKSLVLRKKFQYIKDQKRKTEMPKLHNPRAVLEATKNFLQTNCVTKDDSDSDGEKLTKDDNVTKASKVLERKLSLSEMKSFSVPEQTIDHRNSPSDNEKSIQEITIRKKGNKKPKPDKTPTYDRETEIKIAVGPPNCNPSALRVQIMRKDELQEILKPESVNSYDATNSNATIEELPKNINAFTDLDSDVNVEITNKEMLIDYCQNKGKLIDTEESKCKMEYIEISPKEEKLEISTGGSSSVLTLLQRQLRLHKEKASNGVNKQNNNKFNIENKVCSNIKEEIPIKNYRQNTSDGDGVVTNNKMNKNFERHNNLDFNVIHKNSTIAEEGHTQIKNHIEDSSDDENLIDVIKKLNIENLTLNLEKPNKENINLVDVPDAVNYVNPFRNVDSKISVFVDKLVSPVLMVHNKMNKRFEPSYDIRDIHFTSHIRIVLKNMGVEQPMNLQTVSWFSILRGYSVFMISPLNSGKTLGYIPAVCRLISDYDIETVDSVGPSCIIVCATAKSVGEVEKLAKMFLGLKEKVVSCFAGVDEIDITTSLLNGCDLLICTPSVLVRLLQASNFALDLRRLATFVLDDCERLSMVYLNEIKFCLLKIKEMLKHRANKELKVQYIVASRIWCDFMKPLAKKAPNSVVCIGAFQECVLYSKTHTTVEFVKKVNKINSVMEFVKEIDGCKRTVIVCRSSDEVKDLDIALNKLKYKVFSADDTMTIQDLYNLRKAWDEYEEPLIGPILVCCDGNLNHLNITDAHYLIHYSLPHLFSMFCKRFSTLNENYPSIFKLQIDHLRIKILLEENNVEQLPKILHFIKRCTENVPDVLNDVCQKILAEKDVGKAKNLVPVCDNLLMLGHCPDFWNCKERHAIIKDCDEPKTWVPKNGMITFKILHYHTAVLYSARLISNITKKNTIKYPQTYSTLSLEMGMYYSKENNRKLHGIPKVGDYCAVSVNQIFFVRCQVVKIISHYQQGNPRDLVIKLIDEEKYEATRDIYLYHLPDELKEIQTHVVQVRLANIQPKDKDITFSDLAIDHLKKITDKDEDLYLRGQVIMTIGNCVFVDTLEACQDLATMGETVVKHNFKQDLLATHAILKSDHVTTLKNLCASNNFYIEQEQESHLEVIKPIREEFPKESWAHLDNDDLSSVFFASAENAGKVFIRLDKFEDCMITLLKDIKKYIDDAKPEPIEAVRVGDVVLAKNPDDSIYERARIDGILDEHKVRCFFVDQGDWRDVPKNHLVPITGEFIRQLPFQAIECRLIGVQPAGDEWTEFSTNWLYDFCLEDRNGCLKHLYVKYFTKEIAESTGGHKYGIVMIDTNTDQDILINQLMIDVNLARIDDDEVQYLTGLDLKIESKDSNIDDVDVISDVEENIEIPQEFTEPQGNPTETVQNLFRQPIRSVPLVGSDDSDSDRWDINFTSEMSEIFKPCMNSNASKGDVKNMPAIKPGSVRTSKQSSSDSSFSDFEMVQTPRESIKELDSDDFSTPESTIKETTEKLQSPKLMTEIDKLRKPKLSWRQNKTTVTIKIQLIGVQKYELLIKERSIKFATALNETNYGFDFELYGVIDVKTSRHTNKGQCVLVNLTKILHKNWLTLTRDGAIRKWIVYDADSIDTSSDEEVDQHNDIANILKNIPHESETEDEDFYDDAAYNYK